MRGRQRTLRLLVSSNWLQLDSCVEDYTADIRFLSPWRASGESFAFRQPLNADGETFFRIHLQQTHGAHTGSS